MRRLLRLWLPPLVWMGVIFFVSAQPTVPSVPGRWDLVVKKAMHVIAYGTLTYLYLRALRGGDAGGWVSRGVSAALAVAYAFTDEYHQTFVPGRNGTLVDVGIDGVGVAGVTLLDWWIRRVSRGQELQASQ